MDNIIVVLMIWKIIMGVFIKFTGLDRKGRSCPAQQEIQIFSKEITVKY